jgi:hypothetical protein
MASTATLEGVKKAVFFPFKGEKWGIKILIGSALGLAGYIIPIVPAIPLLGYYGQVMKRVINDDEDPKLPEWTDWGTLFQDGIKVFGTSLIYMLPAYLIMIIGYLLMFVPYFGMMMSISSPSSYSSDLDPSLFFGSMAGMFGGMALLMIGSFLMLVATVFLPPALGNMIAKNDFRAAFKIKDWWPVFKANLSGYILAIAILFGMYALLLMAVYILYFTVVLCFLIPFAICIIVYLLGAMGFSLFAVAYRDGVRKLAEAGQAQEIDSVV